MTITEELVRLKTRRRSVAPAHIHSLLMAADFDRRFGKGDLWVYTHPKRRYPLTIDPRKPLLPSYVTAAIHAIEEVLDDEIG